MNSDEVQQRIAYLVEHGGLYPMARPRWVPWVAALLVVQVLTLAAVLLK
jgi:hypothetical protein